MPVSVIMPRLGESVGEGTVSRWLKGEGDRVTADEPLVEVSTDKVDTEIPAPASGTLLSIRVGEDETARVGVELAVIDDADEPGDSAPAATTEEPAAEPAPAIAPESPPPAAVVSHAGPKGGHAGMYLTPLVRRLADQLRVDLDTVRGTGVGGRIRKSDVVAATTIASVPTTEAATVLAEAPSVPPAAFSAAAAPPTSAMQGRVEPMSRTRQLIASRMVESLQTAAQLTTVVEVDVTRIARLREQAKPGFEAREGVRLTFLPFFAVAAIEALKAHPVVNSSIDVNAKTIAYHDAEHLGIAVDTERGLVVPVIHHAGDLNIGGLARKIADLAERTRTNRVSTDELGGGTFTLTNTGGRGALFDTPIINQPQSAILGTGAVERRPVVVKDGDLGETIAVRSMVYLALSYDHRIVDGADAARFLTTMKKRLESAAFKQALRLD